MRPIFRYLERHFQEAFHGRYYLAVGCLLAASVAANYVLDFKDDYLDPIEGLWEIPVYLAYYALPYGAVLGLYFWLVPRPRRKAQLYDPTFFLWLTLGLGVLALDGAQPMREWAYAAATGFERFWRFQVAANLWSLLTVFVPLAIVSLWHPEPQRFFGLRTGAGNPRPYLWMLLAMLPLLTAASFLASFQKQYPMYRAFGVGAEKGIPEWLPALGFELAYALDFLTVELLFRGFFVLGLLRWMGREAVLPMAVLYCFLHFGKPLGEAVSSIFGGYILGVVSLETRSLWGGVAVHVGIAWMMELLAWSQPG